jgi:hypothetical protein
MALLLPRFMKYCYMRRKALEFELSPNTSTVLAPKLDMPVGNPCDNAVSAALEGRLRLVSVQAVNTTDELCAAAANLLCIWFVITEGYAHMYVCNETLAFI